LPVFAAVLEDALDNDLIEIPRGCADFYDRPAAWLRAEWIGPGRGYIDPVKEAQASSERIKGRTSTLEREAAEQGLDWEMVLEQQAREAAELEKYDLAGPENDLSIVPRSDLEDQRPAQN
jgi:capsid protein